MLNSTMKQLMPAAASAALLVASGMEAQATTTINLAVASNFYGTNFPTTSAIADVIAAFTAAYPSYSVSVVDNGSTGTLVNHITTGNTRGVDLFLAADTSHPVGLYNSYVASNTVIEGIPFEYAIGQLAFWSNGDVDVSCAGTCGFQPSDFTGTAAVVIADPTSAPYGLAAQQYLAGQGVTSPSATIVTSTNIDTTFSQVQGHTVHAGFVALSAICSNGTYPTAGTAYVYPASSYEAPDGGTATYNYNALIQDGIRINYNHAHDDVALNAFITFLTTSSSASLTKYCYEVP